MNEDDYQNFTDVPKEASVISLKDIYLELDFDVFNAANGRYGKG